jgi:tRNA(fMet)-specific endonuclease VapC
MLRYMLDTDICIFVLRNRPAELRQKFRRFEDELCISAITVGELFYGVERSARRIENRRAVEELIGNLTVLPFATRGAAHFAQLRAELTRAGVVCGPYDMLIAGHARSEDLTVVTNNVREFRRIPGLQVENWLQEE